MPISQLVNIKLDSLYEEAEILTKIYLDKIKVLVGGD